MIRSNALRSTTRSLITGNAAARQGSTVIVSPSLNLRMWSWHTVPPGSGPCGTPSTTRPQEPQIPSRQSESKAIGSSPLRINVSFTTSSISRNDMSGLTCSAAYSTIRPAASRAGWRQTFRFSRMTGSIPAGSRLRAPGSGACPLQSLTRPGAWSLEPGASQPSLVTPLRRMHVLPRELFAVEHWGLLEAGELPGGDVREPLVVAQRFSVGRLALRAEVAAAALGPVQRIDGEQFAEFEVVGDAAGVVEGGVQVGRVARHRHVLPELLTQCPDFADGFAQAGVAARHARLVPEHGAGGAMEIADGPASLDREQPREPVLRGRGRFPEAIVVGRYRRQRRAREVVADGVGNDEVAVGQSLHQRAGAQPVRAVIAEVGFPEHVQARQVAHQVVVDPQPAHRVVDSGIDPHRHRVRILVGDPLVHVEQVAVPRLDRLDPQP